MIKIAYLKEKNKIKALPLKVQKNILRILKVIESEYGKSRRYEDYGGYVLVVEKEKDFEVIKNKTYIDCDNIIAEYVDKIVCSDGEVYTNSLILCNNDYAISLIIPLELTPQNLKNYMID